MALSIKNAEADRLARALSRATGETLTEAVVNALRERLQREQGRAQPLRLRDEIRKIRKRCSRLPVLDPRSPNEILGYDDRGLPS